MKLYLKRDLSLSTENEGSIMELDAEIEGMWVKVGNIKYVMDEVSPGE